LESNFLRSTVAFSFFTALKQELNNLMQSERFGLVTW